MTNHYHHKKSVKKSSTNSKQNRTRMLPRFTRLILLATAVGFFSFTSGCQKSKSVDSKNQQTSSQESQKENTPAKTASTDNNNTPAPTENKSPNTTSTTDKTPAVPVIDEAFIIKPGKRMTAKRYFAVREKLKQIGLAFQNSHGTHRAFLPDPKEHPEYYDKNGRLKVSWRVHLLPFLGQKELFQRFKLDEPWNSPTNAPLAKNMPDIFRSPDTPTNSNRTRFRVFEGERTTNAKGKKSPSSVFPLGKALRIRDMRDGTSNIVMAVEVGADQAIEWTNPEELNPKAPLKAMGATAEGVPSLFADGSVQCIKQNAGNDLWEKLIRPNDEIRVDWHEFIIAHSMLKPEQQRKLNNLKKIALAFHMYHDNYSIFPPSKEHLTDGKPLLSWRVYLLPFLGEGELYKKFNLNEPWDSPHNIKLLDQMPDVYDFLDDFEPGNTIVMTFSGEGTPFPGGHGPRIRDITDGTSNTIMFVLAGREKAVPWTKPADLKLDPANPLKSISRFPRKGIVVAFMDGAVRIIPANISAKTLKNLIQHNDGQRVDAF